MSEDAPPKKVIHRLEPKKRPVVATAIDDTEKLESMEQVAPTVNAHFFGEGPEHVKDVESGWDDVEEKIQSVGRRWLAISVMSFAGVVLIFLCWGLLMSRSVDSPELTQLAGVQEQELSYAEKAASRRGVIDKYLRATTLEEKAKYVRNPERVKPLMEQYYSKNVLLAETPSEEKYEEPIMSSSAVKWRVDARLPEAGQSKYLILETDEAGVSLVDWETDVIYQPSDWEKFISVRSTRSHTFRVFIQGAQLSGFHGYEFADYSKYRCFKIWIPGREDYLWGYTEIGSLLDAQLVSLITSGGRRNINTNRRVRAILALKYPEKSQSASCVFIDELTQAGWIQ
jgi:hypothetical protein